MWFGMAGFERYIYPLPETLRLARLAGAKSAKRLARRAQINIKVLGFCWVIACIIVSGFRRGDMYLLSISMNTVVYIFKLDRRL